MSGAPDKTADGIPDNNGILLPGHITARQREVFLAAYQANGAIHRRKQVLLGNLANSLNYKASLRHCEMIGQVDEASEMWALACKSPSAWPWRNAAAQTIVAPGAPEIIASHKEEVIKTIGAIFFEWIANRDAPALHELAELLERGKAFYFGLAQVHPSFGPPSEEQLLRLAIGECKRPTFALTALECFWNCTGGLPTKSWMRANVEDHWNGAFDEREFTRCLKTLGLSGLPQARPVRRRR